MSNIQEIQDSPLRSLRSEICPSRADFCRKYRIGYQSVTLAESGLVSQPMNLIRILARETGRPLKDIFDAHSAWMNRCAEKRDEVQEETSPYFSMAVCRPSIPLGQPKRRGRHLKEGQQDVNQ